MLFKISISNIRKSFRDYAVYFFTLIIGVSVFYVFNAVTTQTAYIVVSNSTQALIELLGTMLSGVSIFVSVVLGLLIVYASRFLMKRRNKEFALYLILGMGKGKVSAILLIETLIIGIGSLFAGLIAGIGLSQLMSAFVANLFEADMTSYKFTVSVEAIVKTIIYFGIMYVVVMLFNSFMISKSKLIDLMQSGKKSESLKLKNPVFCTFIFIISAAALGYAYYRVAYFNSNRMTQEVFIAMIIIGAVSTFWIFWSVSGLLLHIVMSSKNTYFRGLNSFTFRQISSKINTTVMSMTVINLMLFVTICTLSSAFSVRNSMNANLNELCPADAMIYYSIDPYGESREGMPKNIIQAYEQAGYDITEDFSEYVEFSLYHTEDFTYADSCGDKLESIKERFLFLDYDSMEDIVKLSDYNRLMEVFGKEPLELGNDEYILLCDFRSMKEIRDEVLADGTEITVFGNTLKPRYSECQDGFIEISAQHLNAGIFIVPDSAVGETAYIYNYFIGNYAAETKEEKSAIEEKIEEIYPHVRETLSRLMEETVTGFYLSLNTRIDIAEATVGLGAILALIGLYIGLVFLIASGAVLALKELSECADSVQRYTILRKIGAEERDISKSLFRQTGIFFLLPLLLACIHSVFGMKFAMFILEVFGTEKLMESVLSTSLIIILIYGGYFLITYLCSRSIISEKHS